MILFSFLMLNYLVWDKEKLQNQRESDRIEQDWLRGQNRILNNTVEDLESAISKLQETADNQRARMRTMEQEARVLRQDQLLNQKDILEQRDAIDLYKGFLVSHLEQLTEDWFSSITGSRNEESLSFLDSEFAFWGKKYVEEDYISFISAIEYIRILNNDQEQEAAFSIVKGTDPLIIEAIVNVNVGFMDNSGYSITTLALGKNTLQIGYTYNSMSKSWLIMYIDTKNIASP